MILEWVHMVCQDSPYET